MTKGERIGGLILASPFLLIFFIIVGIIASSDSTGNFAKDCPIIEVKEEKDCTFYVAGEGWVNDFCSNADKYKGYSKN
ncbi:MAG: hypothetical protein P9M02_02235 [Candidatus Susulua stagnicola]|nr:hypothetical protein [Candidatus Susulua stagnicola]